jgi:PTS system N-acetylglucosamine-specific IIC component
MYHTALPSRRRETGGLLMSMGLTSFLTGVTEPIEFTFIFLAPALYVVHALLTGTAMVVMHLLGSRLGFSFSAGLFDYLLNFRYAGHPLYLLPVGAVYFALYYGLFRYFIVRFDLKTPGRGADEEGVVNTVAALAGDQGKSLGFIAALGGADNLLSVDACTTRLRLTLERLDAIDEAALKRLGARGLIRLGKQNLQVVVGPVADQIAGDIRAELASATRQGDKRAAIAAATHGEVQRRRPNPRLAAALGGVNNIQSIELRSGRILLQLKAPGAIDADALTALGVRATARPGTHSLHLLHPAPESLLES